MNGDVIKKCIDRSNNLLYILSDQDLLERIFTARFIWGKDARMLYRDVCDYVSIVIQNDDSLKYYFDEKNGYEITEYPILRAGEYYTINQCLDNIKVNSVDIKRKYSPMLGNFVADVKFLENNIRLGQKSVHIFSDICSASGSTMKCWTESILRFHKHDEEIILIYNLNILSKKSIEEVMKIVEPRGVDRVIFICWGGLFTTYDYPVFLENGERIDPMTILNLSTKQDDSSETARKLYNKYFVCPSVEANFIPDIVGEAGDKTTDIWEKVLLYDLFEFCASGIDCDADCWKDKIANAINHYMITKKKISFDVIYNYKNNGEMLKIFLEEEILKTGLATEE